MLRAIEAAANTEKITGEFIPLLAHDGITQIGYVLPQVAVELCKLGGRALFEEQIGQKLILSRLLDTVAKRTKALGTLAQQVRDGDTFPEVSHGWRDELYTIYCPAHVPYFHAERAFCPLLGVVMYGVHITGYVPPEHSPSGEILIWVPRRAATKQTFPGMLDSTVAGGLGHPLGILETARKESYEEAGISLSQLTAFNLHSTGVIQYVYASAEGFLQPEVQFVFELPCPGPDSFAPVPVDGEVEHFSLMSLGEVSKALLNGEFKPNCAIVMIDFLIKHGYITPEGEPEYLKLIEKMHYQIPLPLR